MTTEQNTLKLRDQVATLERENLRLRSRVGARERELEFLKTHPSLARGLRGERLVVRLTGGALTSYADSHDVVVGGQIKLEVKSSHLNTPTASSTKRWNWSKPLGWKDKGKDYDFLLLIGEKEPRFESQYPDESPFVFFLVPRSDVVNIVNHGRAIGANIALTTNLAKAKSPTSRALKRHLVPSTAIEELLRNVVKP